MQWRTKVGNWRQLPLPRRVETGFVPLFWKVSTLFEELTFDISVEEKRPNDQLPPSVLLWIRPYSAVVPPGYFIAGQNTLRSTEFFWITPSTLAIMQQILCADIKINESVETRQLLYFNWAILNSNPVIKGPCKEELSYEIFSVCDLFRSELNYPLCSHQI